MQDFPSRTRGNKNRSSHVYPPPWFLSDDDDGEEAAAQTRCNPVLNFVFIRQSFYVVSTFFSNSHCLCGGKKNKKNVRTVSGCIRFLFLFSKFYIELCISSNNALILPVCNIRVEICLYIIIAPPDPSSSSSSSVSSSFLSLPHFS